MVMFPFHAARAGADDAGDHQAPARDQQQGSGPGAAEAKPQDKEAPDKKATVASGSSDCGALESAAVRYGLPPGFFRRLIRQESNFDPKAVSRAGALGIAQFMPGTARWRGLADPFEPNQSLNESARWLSELRALFGNLGLAAAAYNAGPQRVKDWIAGRGKLPGETRAYVRIITGSSAEEWLHDQQRLEHAFVDSTGPCTAKLKPLPARLETARVEPRQETAPEKLPGWGLQLIGDASEIRALAEYARLQNRFRSVLGGRKPIVIRKPLGGRGQSAWFFVKLAESTREKATLLCSQLRSAGGSCLVTPN